MENCFLITVTELDKELDSNLKKNVKKHGGNPKLKAVKIN